MPADPLPTHIAIILFPGFQVLDAAGPLDAFHLLAQQTRLKLSILARSLDAVSSQVAAQTDQGSVFGPSIVPTHTFDEPPEGIDMLLLPGGLGSRVDENVESVVAFLKSVDVSGRGRVRWMLTVCTGSEILARTGVLDGRRATTNKRAFNEVKGKHPKVEWVARARWVVDGNIWTSSGISAGMDLAFAWMAEVFGDEVADYVADRSEYERNLDSSSDRFAERWGAV